MEMCASFNIGLWGCVFGIRFHVCVLFACGRWGGQYWCYGLVVCMLYETQVG